DDMMPDSDASSFDNEWPENSGNIIVIDPSQTSNLEKFKEDINAPFDYIKATSPIPGQTIRIPGENAGAKEVEHLSSGVIEISDEVWNEISSLANQKHGDK